MPIRPNGKKRPVHWVRAARRGPETVTFGWNLDFPDEEEADVTVKAELTPEEKRTWDYPGAPASANVFSIVRDETGEEVDPYGLPEGVLEDLEEQAFEVAHRQEEAARAAAEDAAFESYRESGR
jgi:hypothetical protein